MSLGCFIFSAANLFIEKECSMCVFCDSSFLKNILYMKLLLCYHLINNSFVCCGFW